MNFRSLFFVCSLVISSAYASDEATIRGDFTNVVDRSGRLKVVEDSKVQDVVDFSCSPEIIQDSLDGLTFGFRTIDTLRFQFKGASRQVTNSGVVYTSQSKEMNSGILGSPDCGGYGHGSFIPKIQTSILVVSGSEVSLKVVYKCGIWSTGSRRGLHTLTWTCAH